MFRIMLVSLTVVIPCCSQTWADDSRGDKTKESKGIVATFVMADVAKSTITFKATDKSGKTIETKLALDKNAKVLGSDDKPESLSDFVKKMESRIDKSIIIVEDKDHQRILEIKDIPKKL